MAKKHVSKRRRSIAPVEVGALAALSLLVHIVLLWVLMSTPTSGPSALPPATSGGTVQTVTVDLQAPKMPETPETPPPEDQNALTPPPKLRPREPVPETEPKPVPRPKPVEKPVVKANPRQVSKAESTPAPREVAEASVGRATQSGKTSASTAQAATPSADGNGTSGAASQNITPAISGMQSLGNPPPPYPSMAMRRRIEGTVVLRILVKPDGRAGQVVVMRSSGSDILDSAAVETVKKWRFIPAKRGGVPLSGYAIQRIDFRLPD